MQDGKAVGGDGIAQRARQCIDAAALDAGGGDHRFAAHAPAIESQRQSFQRLTLAAQAENLRPVDQKAAVRRRQRRNRNAPVSEQRCPFAGRAEARPACPAERQHDGLCRNGGLAVRGGEQQALLTVPAQPAMPRAERYARPRKPRQPGAQQWRCFHGSGKHASAGPDERRLSQLLAPGAHRNWRECFHGRA